MSRSCCSARARRSAGRVASGSPSPEASAYQDTLPGLPGLGHVTTGSANSAAAAGPRRDCNSSRRRACDASTGCPPNCSRCSPSSDVLPMKRGAIHYHSGQQTIFARLALSNFSLLFAAYACTMPRCFRRGRQYDAIKCFEFYGDCLRCWCGCSGLGAKELRAAAADVAALHAAFLRTASLPIAFLRIPFLHAATRPPAAAAGRTRRQP